MGRLFKAGPNMYWTGMVEQLGPRQYVHYPDWPERRNAGRIMTANREGAFDEWVRNEWWANGLPTRLLLPEGV